LTGQILCADGTENNPSYSFTNNQQTGMWYNETGGASDPQLNFSVGGVEFISLDTSGTDTIKLNEGVNMDNNSIVNVNNINATNVYATSTIEADLLVLDGTYEYKLGKWGFNDTYRYIQQQTSNQPTWFTLFPADQTGLKATNLILYINGSPSDVSTFDALYLQMTTSQARILSNSSSATSFPLRLYTKGNAGQLDLENDGTIDMSTGDVTIDGGDLYVKANDLFAGDFDGGDYTQIDATGNIKPKGSAFLIFEKASGNGIKVDQSTPTFGYADIIGDQFSKNTGGTKPTLAAYNGVVNAWQFSDGEEQIYTSTFIGVRQVLRLQVEHCSSSTPQYILKVITKCQALRLRKLRLLQHFRLLI
jgi:hypothetical protein